MHPDLQHHDVEEAEAFLRYLERKGLDARSLTDSELTHHRTLRQALADGAEEYERDVTSFLARRGIDDAFNCECGHDACSTQHDGRCLESMKIEAGMGGHG